MPRPSILDGLHREGEEDVGGALTMTERNYPPDQELQVPIPLRSGVVVRIYMPADLKKSEADRIARIVNGYVDGEGK